MRCDCHRRVSHATDLIEILYLWRATVWIFTSAKCPGQQQPPAASRQPRQALVIPSIFLRRSATDHDAIWFGSRRANRKINQIFLTTYRIFTSYHAPNVLITWVLSARIITDG